EVRHLGKQYLLETDPKDRNFLRLVEAWTKYKTLATTNRLSEVRLLLSQLSTTVSNMKPGGGGGAFEWTDSMFVKALKNGDWLLIDNVNFC
ncbi:unnamed protein product, partial [Candidula unifasciata]